MLIRPATPLDIAAILAVWNPVIRQTEATFNNIEKTAEMLLDDLATKARGGYAFFLATHDIGSDRDRPDKILGFATYGQFRASNGYRHTMEHTIILSPDARGKGVGRALMARLEAHARARGTHTMIAGVSHANTAGLGFHTACGYDEIARLPEVGFKFNQWYDLVLMQKRL